MVEKTMDPHDVAKSYDNLADHWNGDSFHRENGMDPHRRALQFVEARGSAIDIGCGSSGRFIDLLLSEGFETEGLDLSAEMLRLAKERHPSVPFHHADICTWEPEKRYDFITAWDSIWHAPLAQHEAILSKLCNALTDNGVLIFTSGAVDEPGDTDNPCMGQPMYHAAPGIPALLNIIAANRCIVRHLELDQWPEKHLYLIVQKV